MIGEGFPAELSEDIAGLVLSTRRQADRISMWTKTSADEAMQKRIGCVAAPRGTGCDFFFGGGAGGVGRSAAVPRPRDWAGLSALFTLQRLLGCVLVCWSAAGVECRWCLCVQLVS